MLTQNTTLLSYPSCCPNKPFPIPRSEKAPEVLNTTHRIVWSDSGIESYRDLINPTLLSLRDNWKNPQSSVSFSLLLQCMNEALTAAAKASNTVIDLSKPKKPKPSPIPLDVSAASKEKSEKHKIMQNICQDPVSTDLEKSQALSAFSNSRKKHRRLWRRHQSSLAAAISSKTDEIITTDPQNAHKQLKALKSSVSGKISELKVGEEIFYNNDVADGFFKNINTLKTMSAETRNCESCETMRFDYNLITEIAKAGQTIPIISLQKAEELLHSLKPHVCDHFNVSALHFIHGGPLAVQHFQFLINSAIENLEATTCDEMNVAHACVLHKGHSKDKNLASSYRTISSCPFVSKALDFYVRELSIPEWNAAQPETQFLGSNKSHELGALLLTETINHSIIDNNKPLYSLFLDARSAFDLTIREITVRKLHHICTSGLRLVYLENRLKNRKTVVEMGQQNPWPHHRPARL